MASNGTIAHRFANRDYNESRGLKGNSTHISGRNYFSYSTVFGQWVDIEKKVCLVYLGSTSVSSSKHQLGSYCFPKDVTVLPYDDGGRGGYGYWHGCNLIGEYGTEFTERDRMTLVHYYASCIYDQLAAIVEGKTKGLERINFYKLDYIKTLSNLYKDVSIKKYLTYIKKNNWKDNERDMKTMVKMAKMLDEGERDVKTLVNAMFGGGTFERYWNYCARYRKAENKKLQMIVLCNRLGIRNPYESEWRSSWKFSFKADEVRKLTAKQRNEIHFSALMQKKYDDNSKAREEKYSKNKWNAYKWIVGYEPQTRKSWYGDEKITTIAKCRNKFTGEEYDIEQEHVFGYYWLITDVEFDYNSFRKSENKEEWIREFYAKCKEAQENRKALKLLKKNGVVAEKVRSYEDDRFTGLKDVFSEPMTEDEIRLCLGFIDMQNAHYAMEEARERAERMARERAEAERKAEEEYRAAVKQEQIDECLERGEEGCRDLWRKHLDEVYNAARRVAGNNDNFFYGGNVLLRFSFNKTHIETSKHIRIPIAVAKKFWPIIKKWHENPSSFKPIEIDTKGSGKYTISSYEDDILTAGCHDIAFCEMERMYNEIIANENVA